METASRLYVPGLDQHQTLPPPLARIPAPIGGVPSELDFAPSCLFVALYASLVPIALYRLFARSSRNLIVIFSLGFLVERLTFFIIRSSEARAPAASRASPVYLAYAQSTLAAGFLSVGKDLVAAVRALLIHSSAIHPPGDPELEWEGKHAVSHSANFADEPAKLAHISAVFSPSASDMQGPYAPWKGWWGSLTRARERVLYDVASVILSAAFIVDIALSLSSGGTYAKAIFVERWAEWTVRMRYISCGVGLLLVSLVHVSAYWAWARNPAMGHASVMIVSVMCILLSVVGVYRLIVMGAVTEDFLSTGPGSLNSTSSKATFYVFHVAPEWLAVSLLLSVNVRRRFVRGGRVCEEESVRNATV